MEDKDKLVTRHQFVMKMVKTAHQKLIEIPEFHDYCLVFLVAQEDSNKIGLIANVCQDEARDILLFYLDAEGNVINSSGGETIN